MTNAPTPARGNIASEHLDEVIQITAFQPGVVATCLEASYFRRLKQKDCELKRA